MADVFDGISQTDEWQRRLRNDSRVNRASEAWEKAMEKAAEILPFAVCDELRAASAGYTSACEDAGILYGFYAAMEIQRMAAYPQIVQSQYLARQEAAAV